MKKIIMTASIILLFSSCYEEYVLLINNESSYDVSFNLTTGYRTANYILGAGKQFSHSMIERHSHKINDYEPKGYVILSADGNTYTFNNIPIPDPPPDPDPIPAWIFNTLSKDVILDGDGAISTDPLTVEAYQEIKTETIIKENPVFKAETTEGYPVQVYVNFKEIENETETETDTEEETEKIYMIILK